MVMRFFPDLKGTVDPMATHVKISPVTRIEGHLAIDLKVESNQVVQAFSSGEMFRGLEVLLKGRDPLDAHQIVQRICGVCPVSHGTASIYAQDQAYNVTIPSNGRLLRNLILGANYIQSHILHFYHLTALDYVDVTAITGYQGSDPDLQGVRDWVQNELKAGVVAPAAPFLPRYEGKYLESAELNVQALKHYLEALEMRKLAHQMCAIFAGKMPHPASLIPGGVTQKPTAQKIAAYAGILQRLQMFIDHTYLPDVIEVAKAFKDYFKIGKGYDNFLSFGVFPESGNNDGHYLPAGILLDGKPGPFDAAAITEDVKYSRYSSVSGAHPKQGETSADPRKADAYSWIKAPRYQKQPMEVGPLARMLVAYHQGQASCKSLIDGALQQLGATPADLNSVMGRHAARALECKIVADRCGHWLDQLTPDKPGYNEFEIPASGSGMGLTEAPRGALGHWITIEKGKIGSYQCIVPTTWNCSPRDDRGIASPVEKALEGTPIAKEDNPIEAARVVRSFDPCIACAVH
jgi:Ni,Fe-hydrogenase I large subunit